MAPTVIPISPALRTAVIQCVKEPAASQKVQQAAIQVFRQTPVPDEVGKATLSSCLILFVSIFLLIKFFGFCQLQMRDVFMQVLLDNSKPVQERVAAYLIIMKDPELSELKQLTNAMSSEANQQFKSFVISHITNILSSTEPETEE